MTALSYKTRGGIFLSAGGGRKRFTQLLARFTQVLFQFLQKYGMLPSKHTPPRK